MSVRVCKYCAELLEVASALNVRFEDRLIHFDMGLNRYSKLCKQSPTRRHEGGY